MDDLTGLLAALVAIDSVNPSLVPGGAGETEIARFVSRWARGERARGEDDRAGRPADRASSSGPAGPAAAARCSSAGTSTRSASTAWPSRSHRGSRATGSTARGSYDMKAGVAAALIACRDAAAAGPRGRRRRRRGRRRGVREPRDPGGARARCSADAAVVTEPTELELVVAHKGFVWLELEVTGRAAHGSRPHLGVDAIVKTGPLLVALAELDRALGANVHPLLGRGSIHASLIDGGTELSSYPARCTLKLERRTLPGETTLDVEAEIDGLLAAAASADPALVVERRTLLAREPFEVDQDAEIVSIVGDALGALEARRCELLGRLRLHRRSRHPDGAARPIGGEGAHAVEEWVSLADTATVARTLLATAEVFCR